LAPAGCGTDVDQILAQSGSSAVFTLMDIFLTDAANSILDQQQPPPDRDRDDDDDEGDGDGGGDGAASPGEAAYVAQGCGVCHGDNAEGGSGPALAGIDELAALEDRFAGGASHLGTTLTDQEIQDVAAWLLGDDTADGGNGDDELTAGADAYAAGNCAACHGAQAEGASGPAMAGMDELAALEGRFTGGANHFGSTLTDEEINSVAAWLASL
jgi:cytochrome c551